MSLDGTVSPRIASSRRTLLGIAVGCTLALGCDTRAQPTAKPFIPPVATARAALTTALDAWKDGRPSGRIDAQPAAIQFVDLTRKPDQRLTGFEILGEVPDDHYRCFKVRLFLEQPDERPLVRYFIFGMNPLWVYRADDLEMITHWDHHIDPADDTDSVPADRKSRERASDSGADGPAKPATERHESRGAPDTTPGPT
jgi:hypothetical protein